MRSTAPRSRTTVVSSPACAFSKLPRKVEDLRYEPGGGLSWRRLSGIGSYTSPALLPTRSEVRPPGGMLPDPAVLSPALRLASPSRCPQDIQLACRQATNQRR